MLDQSKAGIVYDMTRDRAGMSSKIENQTSEKEIIKKHSNSPALQKRGTIESTEGPSSLALVDNIFSDKIEHNADLSSTHVPKSMESTIIGKSAPGEGSKRTPRTSNPKKLSIILQKKQNNMTEFDCEKIKQNNMNFSNFGNLICLQFIDEDKRQIIDASPKESKNTISVWVAKFSPDNRWLATGSSNGKLKIYSVTLMDGGIKKSREGGPDFNIMDPNCIELEGHKNDITDLSWSPDSKMILTSSIDRSVILWDVDSRRILKTFEHPDIVSCVSFSPLVDGYFASGCFDKIIRIWDLNETKVKDWVQTTDIITALTFSPDRNYLLVGFVKGVVKIYKTDKGKLRFFMEITCKNKFSWGKTNKYGKKVTGIVFTEDYEFLVMTNDSRMRLIDFKTFETKMKYKGHSSGKYHIQPSYNNEKEMILCGSEDGKVYVWGKESYYVPQINPLYTRQKKNRNTSYEYFKPFQKANTTCAIWLPFPLLKKYKENVLSVWQDMYIDNLMILFSSDSRIKILGNVIEL